MFKMIAFFNELVSFLSTLIFLKSVYFTRHVLMIAFLAQGHELFKQNHAAALYKAKN